MYRTISNFIVLNIQIVEITLKDILKLSLNSRFMVVYICFCIFFPGFLKTCAVNINISFVTRKVNIISKTTKYYQSLYLVAASRGSDYFSVLYLDNVLLYR